jgi:hypothetical protein
MTWVGDLLVEEYMSERFLVFLLLDYDKTQ